jgi:hypothetical protein
MVHPVLNNEPDEIAFRSINKVGSEENSFGESFHDIFSGFIEFFNWIRYNSSSCVITI